MLISLFEVVDLRDFIELAVNRSTKGSVKFVTMQIDRT